MNNSIFISYRRAASAYLARAVFQDMRMNDIDAFMDIQSIDTGQFDTIIMNQIAARPYFLLILTPGTLDRCAESGDWLLKEIQQAVTLQRLIVLLVSPNFKFEDCRNYLPEPLKTELPRWNAVNIPHDYFEEAMARLRTRFLKPTDLSTTPTPKGEQKAVETKIQEILGQKPVTENQLSAQDYFERGLARRSKEDYDGAIADYDEAIRLDPTLAMAYKNRGFDRNNNGDYDGAIADYDEAIRLNLNDALAYNSRGMARYHKGDYKGAIADYNEAMRLDPTLAVTYSYRGLAYAKMGNKALAVADYRRVLEIDPNYGRAKVLRDYIARHGEGLFGKFGSKPNRIDT